MSDALRQFLPGNFFSIPTNMYSVRPIRQEFIVPKLLQISKSVLCNFIYRTGPGCSKLKTSLVNVLLKFKH